MPNRGNLMRLTRSGTLTALLAVHLALTGCAASRLMMRYGDLSTQTEVSESVFLELRTDFAKTVYVTETSTVGREFSMQDNLERHLAASGYALVEEPQQATYLVQVNHLQLTEFELSNNQTLADAIDAAILAGGTAGLAVSILGADGRAAGAVGLTAGLIGFVVDAKTKHIAHTLTTDVLITESVPSPDGSAELRFHETRIVSGASKVNLKIEESLPVMVEGVSQSLSRILPEVETVSR